MGVVHDNYTMQKLSELDRRAKGNTEGERKKIDTKTKAKNRDSLSCRTMPSS